MNNAKLTEEEIRRYSRQLLLSNWSAKKQLRLRSLTVQVSHPVTALYLAAAGLGQILLSDEALSELPENLLKELCPQTVFSRPEIPLNERPIDCIVLHAKQGYSAPQGVPTFTISNEGVHRQLEGPPVLVLPFAEGYSKADLTTGGLGGAAIGALAVLTWLAESGE